MKISHEKPSCYDRLKAVFGIDWDSGLIITYGGVIHCKNEVQPEFMAHEMVHVKQQEGIDPDEYLERYIADPIFRRESEIEAYQAQAEWIFDNVKDINERWNKIQKIRLKLSSMYGDIGINYSKACDLIKYKRI